MRKIRNYIVWITVLAPILALTGCGQNEPDPTTVPTTEPTTEPTTAPTTEPPLTADQVYASAEAAMAEAEATRMRMELGFSMRATQGEGDDAVTTEISYNMMAESIVSTEPFGSYTISSITMGTTDFSMDLTVKSYMVEEDESVVSYMSMLGMWTRSDSGMSVSEFVNSNQMTEVSTDSVWTSGQIPADLTLDEFTRDLDGTEVYILHCNIPMPDMSETFASLGVEIGEEANSLSYPVTYFVDTQSYTVLRVEADLQVMMDLLTEAMVESSLGGEAEGMQIEIQITDAVYDLGYGPQEVPAVPQEAYDYIAQGAGIGDIVVT